MVDFVDFFHGSSENTEVKCIFAKFTKIDVSHVVQRGNFCHALVLVGC